jgi:hypothetical protein
MTQQITLTIEDAVKASGLARSRLYQLMGSGELVTRKAGKRTLITGESLRNYIDNLPPANIRAPQIKAAA